MKAVKQQSGNYKVRIYDYTDAAGKKHYKAFTAPTKREAELKAAEYQNGKKQTPQDYGKMSLREAYQNYLEIKSNVLSPSTFRAYEGYSRYSFQELMPLRLNNITQEMIQRGVNEYAANHTAKAVRNIHSLLSAVLSVYKPSMVLATTLPQKIKKNVSVPSEAQIQALLKASEERYPDLYRAILLGAYGTLRRSEVCALTKADVTDSGVIVNKALVQDYQKNWILKTVKTEESARFVPLPPEAIEKLLQAKGDKIVDKTPNAITDSFRRLCRSVCGVSYNFHITRHFAATLYHSAGVSDHWIMEHGGWTNTSTLHNIYVGSISEEEQRQQDIAFAQIKV